jgi:FemAB-related protein (PEP-CTERM system-associated)
VNSVGPFTGDRGEWDDYVRADPASSFCHLANWWTLMDERLGHRAIPLAARDDGGALTGVLPLVHVRSRVFGAYLVSMPFLNAGGPLGDGPTRAALAAAAEQEARRSGVALLELRNRSDPPDWGQVSHRKITVELALPGDTDTLWRSFPGKLRSQVRRPEKEGFTVRFGADQMPAFYQVFAWNMRALGTPVLPRGWFEALAPAFGDVVEFGVVYDGDRPIASGCGFVWQGRFEITWAASLRAYSRSAPNMLLYWAFMQRMIGRGAHTFDFGRCTPDSGTHRFKRQWGGHDVPLSWSQWSASGATATPSPDRPVFRVAAACWRRVPLAITNRVGPVIARCLP